MPEPRNYQTEAVIIKKIKLGEADRILTLYTPKLGKIRAVAKGVRRPKSKLSGHLELLTHSMVSLARGKNLDTITGSQTINSFLSLKSDLELTSCALYFSELTDQFAPEHSENETLFRLLLNSFERLSQKANREMVLRLFEMQLLETAGYRPELYHCIGCRSNLEPVNNSFVPNSGGFFCPSCSRNLPFGVTLSVNALKVMRLLQNDDRAMLDRLVINRELAGEVENTLKFYIRFLLEKEVKSAAWLDDIKGLSG
jgi:DNA repair protein RecO (recombination protein O)